MSGQNRLRTPAALSLVITSFIPLFLILIVRQICIHWEYYVGNTKEKISWLGILSRCWFETSLFLLGLFGIIGLILFLKNIGERTRTNGDEVRIKELENKNSESVTYLFTYIIPFILEDLSKPESIIAIVIFMTVTFIVFMNSTMMVVNPTISLWYTLYLVNYQDTTGGPIRKGMFLTRNKNLREEDIVQIREIGHKLYFSVDTKEGER